MRGGSPGAARVAATFADGYSPVLSRPKLGRSFAAFGRGAVILLAGGFFLFPIYWVVTMAFKPEFEWESFGGKIFWVPQHWTLDNFRATS
jgi:ABC-type glycerol-3-phosphate transport system permease component